MKRLLILLLCSPLFVHATLNVLLVGPPGAGKGTLAASLKAHYGIPHVSGGDLIRDEIKRGTPWGERVKEITNQGRLLPDTPEYTGYLLELVEARLRAPDAARGFILDGIPRTAWQADRLAEMFDRLGTSVDAVVLIAASEKTIFERLANRVNCPHCKRSYNLISSPPKCPGVCDDCQTALEVRADDTPAYIRTRLDRYAEESRPLLDRYRDSDRLVRVDSENGQDHVFDVIKNYLDRANSTEPEFPKSPVATR